MLRMPIGGQHVVPLRCEFEIANHNDGSVGGLRVSVIAGSTDAIELDWAHEAVEAGLCGKYNSSADSGYHGKSVSVGRGSRN